MVIGYSLTYSKRKVSYWSPQFYIEESSLTQLSVDIRCQIEFFLYKYVRDWPDVCVTKKYTQHTSTIRTRQHADVTNTVISWDRYIHPAWLTTSSTPHSKLCSSIQRDFHLSLLFHLRTKQ
ncbi:hypothetical protein OUZ56_017074 [Daphnia magna]|uniref:Uncharacterized protein n=1 Tax=Daphnia magna TaxID=35525 RepID=A0ABR0AS59_9CRUS|nr:hypothetical protein OUZ56_017074 [Daphnia magna]